MQCGFYLAKDLEVNQPSTVVFIKLRHTQPKAAFTPGHNVGVRTQVVSTCIHLLPSTCFLYRQQNCRQFVARHVAGYKGIQV